MVEKTDSAKVKKSQAVAKESNLIELPASITIRQLAEQLKVDSIQIIKQLMRTGIMANINQVISFQTASAIVREMGFEPKIKAREPAREAKARKKIIPQGEDSARFQPRPPVVTVMGHVNHGKTKLLDAIRQTHVMESEAGGITQHIGAYQVSVNDQKITFLDTPGHEAFTAMRAHGAQITDITILVVAADDGVMPQTIEAINHARAAGVPIVVAINKIDRPNANIDLVKQQLAEAGLLIEEWGGDAVSVQISAKEKLGIDELLENLLLVAELEELKADPTRPASGVVIEAEMDKNRGPMATVLVQSGTLRVGDIVVAGTTWGRIRAMVSDTGKQIRKAGPSTPVAILGLASVPQAGDTFNVMATDKQAQTMAGSKAAEAEAARAAMAPRLSNLYDQISSGKIKELNIILKTDVQGSIEPIRSSLEKLGMEEVKINIIHSGTGNVTESDVMLAVASQGLVIGFGVNADEGARRLASSRGIDIRFYDVIYTLIDDVEKALKGMLAPTFTEVIEGRAEVRAVFPATKGAKVIGAYVTEGKIVRNAAVRVIRAGKQLAESTISSLKRFKDDVRDVAAGYECGIGLKDFNDFEVGDILETFRMEQVK